MPLTDMGGFQEDITESLVGSIRTCPWPMMRPRYSIVGVLNEHLVIFRDKPCSHSHWRTCHVHS